MTLSEIYKRQLNWADYLAQQPGQSAPPSEEKGKETFINTDDSQLSSAPSAEMLAGGVSQLSADFSLLLGDVVWRLEMQQGAVQEVLDEIRLAEFEREARAYRTRAERAYLNGWYEEALRDFLEAEKRNYPDYAVLRSIANLHLYHLIDLPAALTYFGKAAKYARPHDQRQAAEAHYFAAIVCLLQQQPAQARNHLQEAVGLYPQFYEAHYQHACLAALCGLSEEALDSLECAIGGDARYSELANKESAFDAMRLPVQILLERMMQPVADKIEQLRREAGQLGGLVIAASERERVARIFQQIEAPSLSTHLCRDRQQMLERLTQAQQQLQHLHERFDKCYAIDPRDYVRSITFSHDGQMLAAGFLNGGVQLWEVDSMNRLHAFTGHYASVNSVAFSPNNLLLVTGSRDRSIKLWETDTGREIQLLHGHEAEVRAVTFSPDGQWLVSGSHDKTIRIWRAATGHEVETLHGHTRPVTSVAFTPDGCLLVSGSWDHTIRLWDLSAGRSTGLLTGHRKGLASLTISSDGHWLASGGEGGEVRLWDLRTGREVRDFSGLRNSVTSVAFSPDNTLLAAGSLGVRIMVWKAATGEIVRQLDYENISYNSVAFSPRGQWLALGNRDLQLWLKAILTPQDYAAVKAGQERAQLTAPKADLFPAYFRLPDK